MSNQPETSARRPRWLPAVAAAAAVAAVAGGAAILLNRPDASVTADALELRLPGATMSMCIPFSVGDLATMAPAFAGTVTALDDERVVLRVDRWYAGGNSAEVVLQAPEPTALLGEIDFEEGKQYLITAEDGTVNLCGFSGEATPELETAFEQAF